MWLVRVILGCCRGYTHECTRTAWKKVDICMFFYTDHAGDIISCTSRSGLLIYMKTTLVQWFSKNYSTLETSVFGPEFVTMKQGIHDLNGIRNKLWMLRIPISGPLYIYGENMSVVPNTSRPESELRKKSNSVCYHAIYESAAIRKCLVGYIFSTENAIGLMTKVLHWQKRK